MALTGAGAAFLVAHTAPFNNQAEWKGYLPRVPDSQESASEIFVIKIQSTVTTDAVGEYHMVVEGDPFQSRLPIWDSTMSLNQDHANSLVGDTGTAGFFFALSQGTSFTQEWTNGVGVGQPSSDMNGTKVFQGWGAIMSALLDAPTQAYSGSFIHYIEQLTQVVSMAVAYRIVGQATRIWSLQGEVQNNTGTFRLGEIDCNMWRMVTGLRQIIGAQGVFAIPVSSTLSSSTPSGLTAVSYFPAFLSANQPSAQADIQSFAGIFQAMTQDWLAGNNIPYTTTGTGNSNTLWKRYLKTAAEASEKAFTYKIFPGPKGATARSAYCRDHIPMQTMSPSMLLYPDLYITGSHNVVTAVSADAQFQSINVVQFATTSVPSNWGPYMTYTGATNVTGGPQTVTADSVVQGLTTATQVPVAFNQQFQTWLAAGLREQREGFTLSEDLDDTYVDGYHIHAFNFLPITPMYWEHVLIVEYVPFSQETGVMSNRPPIDPNWAQVIFMANDRSMFPRLVSGHSFWSSLKNVFHKATSFVQNSGLLSFIPGGNLIGAGLGALDSLQGGQAQSGNNPVAFGGLPPKRPLMQSLQPDPEYDGRDPDDVDSVDGYVN